jgi:hypothetical protein
MNKHYYVNIFDTKKNLINTLFAEFSNQNDIITIKFSSFNTNLEFLKTIKNNACVLEEDDSYIPQPNSRGSDASIWISAKVIYKTDSFHKLMCEIECKFQKNLNEPL